MLLWIVFSQPNGAIVKEETHRYCDEEEALQAGKEKHGLAFIGVSAIRRFVAGIPDCSY